MANVFDSVLEKIGSVTAPITDTVTSLTDKVLASSYEIDNKKNIQDKMQKHILEAIKYNETRGVKTDPYMFRKPSGMAELGDDIGAYQVTAGELKTWAKEFVGREIDPEDFAVSKELQDEYAGSKVRHLLELGATPQEIFALHRGGLTGYADPATRRARVTRRKDYVDSAMEQFNLLMKTPVAHAEETVDK